VDEDLAHLQKLLPKSDSDVDVLLPTNPALGPPPHLPFLQGSDLELHTLKRGSLGYDWCGKNQDQGSFGTLI
jgi:hypothetical protein